MTARDTGALALAALARRWPDHAPAHALETLFNAHVGNATWAAEYLGVGKKSLMAAVAALGLSAWLAERWPNRARGGHGARLGRTS